MRNASSSPSQATERGWFLCPFASLLPDRRGSPQYYIPATFDTWQWSPMVEVGLPRNSGRLEVERGEKGLGGIAIHLRFSPGPETYSGLLALCIYLSASSLLVTAGDCQAARRAYLFVPGIRGSSKKWL